ncbi:MAG: hypothetical protein N2049_05045 [Anaerolineales bacterium]|nr:hypothetical protein [Anaerolineales bacterium]MCX7608570.1 hypothetical protein [Anaerolineales bacterium]
MNYFLGIDVGGTKTHALIADEHGRAVGFAQAGPGNWEAVGYDGLTQTLQEVTHRALEAAGLMLNDLRGAGMGLAGYDWPSQRQAHLDAIAPLGLTCPIEIVNDAVLGIYAGTEEGWGVSIVSGTGCNCRGLNRNRREGRVVGGASYWSGEAAGGFDILLRAMRAVVFEWNRRGPATALSSAFLEYTGAKNLDDLIEGAYLGHYGFDPGMVHVVFEVAQRGDAQALEVMRWAGQELGGMAVGVIRQLEIQSDVFEVVLIGSIFDGHPLIAEALSETIHREAPRARIERLTAPPVVGGVLLGMEAAGVDFRSKRKALIESTRQFMEIQKT